jgi:protein gp37
MQALPWEMKAELRQMMERRQMELREMTRQTKQMKQMWMSTMVEQQMTSRQRERSQGQPDEVAFCAAV